MNNELGTRNGVEEAFRPPSWRPKGRRYGLLWTQGAVAFLATFLILNSFLLIPSALAADTQLALKGIQEAGNLIKEFAPQAGFEGTPREPEIIVGEILQGGMLLIGVLFGIFIIYGGFLWMIARGNEETVKKSIEILKTSIIGFIIVASAYAISDFVIKTVLSAAYR